MSFRDGDLHDDSRRQLIKAAGMAVPASLVAAAATAAAPPTPAAAAANPSPSRPLHPFRRLDLSRTAHVVIDLQNGFMEQGAPVEVPAARDIVPNVNRISAALRSAGGLNIFVRFVLGEESLKTWSVFYEKLGDPDRARKISASFAENQHYAALWPKLEVDARDLVVIKRRFSAFIPGTCDLHDTLQRRGIDTLIITGTLTNVCCESSARDAQQMNYRILFASDATAAQTMEAHNGTIENMRGMFADVATTQELLSFIAAARQEQS